MVHIFIKVVKINLGKGITCFSSYYSMITIALASLVSLAYIALASLVASAHITPWLPLLWEPWLLLLILLHNYLCSGVPGCFSLCSHNSLHVLRQPEIFFLVNLFFTMSTMNEKNIINLCLRSFYQFDHYNFPSICFDEILFDY